MGDPGSSTPGRAHLSSRSHSCQSTSSSSTETCSSRSRRTSRESSSPTPTSMAPSSPESEDPLSQRKSRDKKLFDKRTLILLAYAGVMTMMEPWAGKTHDTHTRVVVVVVVGSRESIFTSKIIQGNKKLTERLTHHKKYTLLSRDYCSLEKKRK